MTLTTRAPASAEEGHNAWGESAPPSLPSSPVSQPLLPRPASDRAQQGYSLRAARSHGWETDAPIVSGFRPRFPRTEARSRCYLGSHEGASRDLVCAFPLTSSIPLNSALY